MARLIFITGGVVSSLGKGLASAALGALLQARGYKVRLRKLDPYLNVDPGTMSPFQHGEVYVTDDGEETDLDLGHYERFTGVSALKSDNVTSGRIYSQVIEKERKGGYLGRTVQVIPHVTDMIKEFVLTDIDNLDFLLVEIGGTVGDIEGLPFFEAIRQLHNDLPYGQTAFVHLTLVPYIEAAGELKTKPTQQSVAKLREIGITPHVLICRSELPLDKEVRQKISLFCNVPVEAVIEEKDVDHSIYEVPLMLQRERLDDLVCQLLRLDAPPANMTHWQEIIRKLIAPQHRVRVGVVGKYIGLQDAYKSVYEAIIHGGIGNDCGVEIVQVDSEEIERDGAEKHLKGLGGILVPGGFGERGIEGKIKAAQYARENKVPYLGLCLGMQIATIEFARNVLKMPKAHSTEFDLNTPNPVIAMLDEQTRITKKGGTMRLGSQPCQLALGSKAAEIYGSFVIHERHRHRYEFNNAYREKFEKAGFRFSGLSPDGKLAEVIELVDHPFFVASQFHPEFQSKPHQPHPLFKSFIAAAHQNIHHKPL